MSNQSIFVDGKEVEKRRAVAGGQFRKSGAKGHWPSLFRENIKNKQKSIMIREFN
jgi:hypothetical protein